MTETTVLSVEGMSCQSCANRVVKALKEVPGVADARVTLAEKKAEVETEGNVDANQLVEAVSRKGYTARLAS